MEMKKRPLRTLSVLLTVAVLFSVFACLPAGAAENLVDGDYEYTVENGKATIVYYDGEHTSDKVDLVVPSTLGGYPVTAISEKAFYNRGYAFKSVELPDSITEIGASAFESCNGMTSIKLPANLETIGNYAFYLCGLTSITIPASVKSIGYEVFYNCYLSSITVLAGNSYYESTGNCLIEKATSKLLCGSSSSVIPEGVKAIEDYAFSNCRGLTSITIPASVTEIGEDAFGNCRKLESITVQAGNPNYEAVNNCLIEKASGTLLRGCSDSVIPKGVKAIGGQAFSYSDVKSIVIPNSVKSIGSCAFYYCTSLTSIFIPKSVTELGWGVFYHCNVEYSIETDEFIDNGFTVYCEAEEIPESWDEGWDYGGMPHLKLGYPMPDVPDEPVKPAVVGDLSGDGKINSTDYMVLKRYVLGTFKLADAYLAFADFSGDGKVNSTDYMLLKRAVLGTYKLPTE